MMKNLSFILFLLLFLGCGSGRELSKVQSDWPDWARKKPIEEGYYTGIGSARKNAGMEQYQRTARQNALNNLAEEISVTVSGNSMLRTVEVDFNLSEYYSSQINIRSEEYLAGYEMVDSFEDDEYYMVYYRLSKSLHEKLKKEKTGIAIDKARAEYENAVRYRGARDYRNTLISLIKGLDELREHLHEPLLTNIDGREVYLANFLVTEVEVMLDEIRINPVNKSITAVRGYPLTPEELSFRISDNEGKPISGMPVSAGFTAQPLVNGKAISGEKGEFGFSIDKITTKSSPVQFIASLDMEEILRSSTLDLTLRKIMWNMLIPSCSMEIRITQPSFFVESDEKNLGRKSADQILKKAFISELYSRNLSVSSTESTADFVVRIEADTRQGEASGNKSVSILKYTLVTSDKEEKALYSYSSRDISGEGQDYLTAERNAYQKGVEDIRIRVIVEVIHKLF
ncbi:MAG: LPP20 family lipoprotein [Bacteroidetes bacterium]|nr:LPP20 family lipoprotein [Bacteroidota bacterium]